MASTDFHLSSLPSDWRITESLHPKSNTRQLYSGFHSGGFDLRSGQYEIILIVDMMEVTGGGHGGKQSRKQMKLDELETLKVDCVNYYYYFLGRNKYDYF